jgi:hypothetical protein
MSGVEATGIPSTDVIRHWVAWGLPDGVDVELDHDAERVRLFEAWLEQFGNSERLAERERIIGLLESRVEPDGSGSVLDEAGCSIADISDLIALIEGEQS